jgi:hypothetical protein
MLSGRTARSRCSRTAVLQRKLLQPLRATAGFSFQQPWRSNEDAKAWGAAGYDHR